MQLIILSHLVSVLTRVLPLSLSQLLLPARSQVLLLSLQQPPTTSASVVSSSNSMAPTFSQKTRPPPMASPGIRPLRVTGLIPSPQSHVMRQAIRQPLHPSSSRSTTLHLSAPQVLLQEHWYTTPRRPTSPFQPTSLLSANTAHLPAPHMIR